MIYNRGILTFASPAQEETGVEPDPPNQDCNGYNNDTTAASNDLDFMAFRNFIQAKFNGAWDDNSSSPW
jgi:hypothetical protein